MAQRRRLTVMSAVSEWASTSAMRQEFGPGHTPQSYQRLTRFRDGAPLTDPAPARDYLRAEARRRSIHLASAVAAGEQDGLASLATATKVGPVLRNLSRA
jgi:hypothetical protein